MSVSIKFEAGQDYQLEAIDAVCSLFQGWNSAAAQVANLESELQDSTAIFSESVFSNAWGLTDEDVLSNARRVQARTRFNFVGDQVPIVQLASSLAPSHVEPLRDFSIEMETGTGKTYVYLRTAIELYLKFNLSKFVIVVPTVAIREGVVASLELMKQHFREVYAGVQYDSYVYDSKNINRLRQFATSKHLQILVMNIQAFNRDSNVILNPSESLGYHVPIDFIKAVKPVVIMDEPQKLDAKLQKSAIEGLNPLFRLRYSATHKDPHCLVYRLGPVDAYERRLVKRIEVLSMSAEEDLNIAYVEVRAINLSSGQPTATVMVNMHGGRKQKTIRANQSLSEVTSMKVYEGWDVEDIVVPADGAPGYVQFRNGRVIPVNTSSDIDQDWWQRAQISAAIEKHFETEYRLMQAAATAEISPMKPLTLFFIDRVANYDPEDGKFKIWFDELYTDMATANRKYRNLNLPEAKDARRGYFASTKGKAKDTKGDSNDDADAYDLIMKDKERLLSLDEPVRFIFSHSALSEGWDNPNVFTICNLQEVQSEVKRRQQIGRGLRLPVMANGERCRNDRLNLLTVIASESFEKYAAGLQAEMQKDTGENFGGAVVDARKRREVKLHENYKELPGFKELWQKIAPKTRYELRFSSQDLIDEASKRLSDLGRLEPITIPKILVRKGVVELVQGQDVAVKPGGAAKEMDYARQVKVPDILSELQGLLPVSRDSIAKVIQQSGRLQEAKINPAQFVNQVRRSIQQALAHTLVDHTGIKYFPLTGEGSTYSASFFDERIVEAYSDNIVDVKKSIYDAVICDSNVEREFAQEIDKRDDIELFIKLPDWFKIATPIGGYNPDWAIVRKMDSGEKRVYLVRETKGTTDVDALRFEGERWKIEFGRQHFLAIAVDYKITSKANQLDVDFPFKLNDGENLVPA